MTRLLIIDDHEVVRKGLGAALQGKTFATIDYAGSVQEGRSKIAVFNPDAIIVDLNLPDGSGFEIVQWVRQLSSEIAIVILSLNDEEQFVKAAKSGGANAYLSKSQTVQEIEAALLHAIASPRTFSSSLRTQSSISVNLTARELNVLHLLADGASNAQICSALFVSPSTVKTHVSSILRKLESQNRTEAVKIARQKGLLLQ